MSCHSMQLFLARACLAAMNKFPRYVVCQGDEDSDCVCCIVLASVLGPGFRQFVAGKSA